MYQLLIVIPVYNEEKKLQKQAFENYLQEHEHDFILFVDDASSDNSKNILEEINAKNVFVLNNEKNQGKAASVRNGMLYAIENFSAKSYAYLDADLATTLEECKKISLLLHDELQFVFASRLLTLGAEIQRRAFRHYTGRLIATAISKTLKLKIYDTQCGCKCFNQTLVKDIFTEKFISKWLFDVEIIFRMLALKGREKAQRIMKEIPLQKWIDQGDSKVKLTYFFKLWYDLFLIKKRYRNI